VSRETFYVWKRRRDLGDPEWFVARSHAPKLCRRRTPEETIEEIVSLRRRFPHFGPRKLLRFHTDAGGSGWPAASTIGEILSRRHLVETQRRRRPVLDAPRREIGADAPNEEWAVDFKGWFRTRDGTRIDPLTVTDSFSRFLIETRIIPQTIIEAQAVFTRVFEEHGLPLAIRSDNGAPFGSRGPGGLTRLSAWWLKLGIEPHFIRPGHPQENGRHERMHRTMKAQTSSPAAAGAEEQQARFDDFRRHYNEERPHEGVGQVPPARLYRRSERTLPSRLEDPWYDATHEVRRVRQNGAIKWRGEERFLGEAFAGELVGLAEVESGDHVVRFCAHDLGILDRGGRFWPFAPPRAGLREAPEPAAKVSGIIPVQNVRTQPG